VDTKAKVMSIPRIAIVTGGSRGLGLMTVRHLVSGGWNVGSISREFPATEKTVHGVTY